jgi:hypothetical protein
LGSERACGPDLSAWDAQRVVAQSQDEEQATGLHTLRKESLEGLPWRFVRQCIAMFESVEVANISEIFD